MHLPILGNLPIIGDFPLHIHVTLRCVHITILAVEKQYLLHIWVCVCSFSYPTCKAVDCIVLPSVACLAYLINGTIFRKRVNEHKICFDFLCNFFSEKFLILRRIKQDSIVNVNRSFCHILIKLEYSQQIFKKIVKDQISQQSIQREVSYSMQTHRQTDRTKLIANLRNFANAPDTFSWLYASEGHP
jgi:hypothetical protein